MFNRLSSILPRVATRTCTTLRTNTARYTLSRTFASFKPVTSGDFNTTDFRMYLTEQDKIISPWHDIPLKSGSNYNFVNEIPKGVSNKMEIDLKEKHNPIVQDTKKGALRYLTYLEGKIPFNYGAFPQTFEDPNEKHLDTGYPGDSDPVDVVELSDEALPMGSVVSVKVLGCLAMIDEGETDWKVLTIASDHPLADKMNTPEDLETHMPGKIDAVRNWFRYYKTTDGKGENSFAFDGQVKDVDYTTSLIKECEESYVKLCKP